MREGEDMQPTTVEADAQISARIPVGLRRRLAIAGIERGRHQQDIVAEAIEQWLTRNDL
jgi:predicted DNA-binding protein